MTVTHLPVQLLQKPVQGSPVLFIITTIGFITILLAITLVVNTDMKDMQLFGRMILPYHYVQPVCHEREVLIGRVPMLIQSCK